MNWHKKPRDSYHHGNLREALINAALELIGSKGTGGFTFAEAARHAGVSAAAPYRHYKDRDALLADVAREGFEAFGKVMQKASSSAKGSAFTEMGKSYLKFAHDNPAYYSAMFESGLDFSTYPDLRKAAGATLNGLRNVVEEMIEKMPEAKRPPATMVTLHIWAISHGVASLFGRGDGAAYKQAISAEDLLESQMLIYLDGLGIKR